MIRLEFREVGILSDVRDECVGEESGEVFDELGWKRWQVGGWGAGVRGLTFAGWGSAAGLIERVCRCHVNLHVVGRQWLEESGLQPESFPGRAAGPDYPSRYSAPYAAVRRRLRTICSRIHRTWEAGSMRYRRLPTQR